MEDLTSRKCRACGPDTPVLGNGELQRLMAGAGEWVLDGSSLVRQLEFKNFRDAFGMATRVALLAEDEGHHPDFEIGWGTLKLTLTTHAARGLTDNDFIMAAKIDAL
ncbi:MAG: 4a-hydroxytetrahydrobiopterin dehydratase [Actinomycetota bacterium]